MKLLILTLLARVFVDFVGDSIRDHKQFVATILSGIFFSFAFENVILL